MGLPSFSNSLLWLRVAFQLAVLVWLVRRKLIRSFPFFSAYLLAEALYAIAYIIIHQMGDAYYPVYFRLYWASFALGVLLRIAVIREVLRGVFARHEGIRDAGVILFRWGTVGIFLLAIAFVAIFRGSESSPLISGLFVLARTVNAVQLGLMLVLFGMAAWFGLPWRNFAFGVALGFGVYAGESLLAFTLHMGGMASSHMLTFLDLGGYLLAVLVWVLFLRVREPVQVQQMPPEFALERWNQELIRILNR